MSTVITANCSVCKHDLKLNPTAVRVFTYTAGWPGDYYAFFCPNCRAYVTKDADQHVVCMLASGGVQIEVVEVPLEVVERKACKTRLNPDDLLNLIVYLREHDTIPEQFPLRRTSASRHQGAP